VLVHGLAVSHRYLMPTARELAARRPVIVPDLPGFGRSDKPDSDKPDSDKPDSGGPGTGRPGRAYGVDEHARALSDWLDGWGLERICLVGHSFGAEVAARLAVRRPDVVAALVLAGPTTDPEARTWGRLVARFAADALMEQPWQTALLAEGIAAARPWRVAATVQRSLDNAIEEDLVRLPVAPLVIGGRLDPIAPLPWQAQVAALSGGTAVTVTEAAHNVLTTSPRRSAAAIDAYVRSSGVSAPR
jgi:pimeloyl-ACP methyl ester carboxylesterase